MITATVEIDGAAVQIELRGDRQETVIILFITMRKFMVYSREQINES